MLKNAVISSEHLLPSCQDTGTAIVMGKKGQSIWTEGSDAEALSKGIFKTYTEEYLRYSQNAPLSMYEEVNTKCNLPAQIDIEAVEGDEYKFLFMAKGGGSANKTFLYQETRAVLNPVSIRKFFEEKMKYLGTSACPPYHLAIVIGGTSAEINLKAVKLASAKYLDTLPVKGSPMGHAFRDLEMEALVMDVARKSGLGAQFGGKYFALDARVIRLPRHGASLPIGIGVSCSADRNITAKINEKGIYLEELDRDPARFLPSPKTIQSSSPVEIDINRPMNEIRAELSKYPIRTRLSLSGSMIVARDIAHAKLKDRVDAGGELPDYFKNKMVYYAGPAKTPNGMASGSFGPTTAGRMDSYVDFFQSRGGSMVMVAKGNRSSAVKDACKKHGGFYLGSIGGPAAFLAKECITAVRMVEFEELGMEAVWEITVKDFPAFIIIDDKGNDFFEQLP
jgi:fumarate hydratase class I